MGELHLEVIKHRLLRDFNLNVRVHKPRVSYRETVEHAGRSRRRMPPPARRANRCSPRCAIRIEPFRKAGRRAWSCRPAATSLPEPYLVDRDRSARPSRAQGGGLLGFPLMQVKITVLGRRGARDRFERDRLPLRRRPTPSTRRLQAAGTVLLEPIMKLRNHHARGAPGRLRQRPAAAPRDHHAHAAPRPQHGDRGRSPAGQPVRLFQRHARPEPGPGDVPRWSRPPTARPRRDVAEGSYRRDSASTVSSRRLPPLVSIIRLARLHWRSMQPAHRNRRAPVQSPPADAEDRELVVRLARRRSAGGLRSSLVACTYCGRVAGLATRLLGWSQGAEDVASGRFSGIFKNMPCVSRRPIVDLFGNDHGQSLPQRAARCATYREQWCCVIWRN